MNLHYFRCSVLQFVEGMDDTAVVAVQADSKADAIEAVCEQHLSKDDRYSFTEAVWDESRGGDSNRPGTTPVHYLGTAESLFDGDTEAVMLSETEGERVTIADLE
jgi:hypothetical protein